MGEEERPATNDAEQVLWRLFCAARARANREARRSTASLAATMNVHRFNGIAHAYVEAIGVLRGLDPDDESTEAPWLALWEEAEDSYISYAESREVSTV